MIKEILHWLFDYQNPYQLYNAAAVTLWILIFANWGFTFGPAEYAGSKAWHDMCYATDVLRCLPRAFWIGAGLLAFFHFDFHRKSAVIAKNIFETPMLQEVFTAIVLSVFLYPIILYIIRMIRHKLK